jgi:hypothetical protein
MNPELIILGITGFFIANAYHDGKYVALLKSWKKYYQMAFYGFLGLSLYLFLKRHPNESRSLIKHANGIIKYMPIDKETTDMLTPIFDFTGNSFGSSRGESRLINSGTQGGATYGVQSTHKPTKRSVSETKKKYVASQQNWQCQDCSEQLTAWFEVHHKVPLEHGGSNHIDNLVALCRNCHGAHTALDNL